MASTVVLKNATLTLTQPVAHGWVYDWQTLIAGIAAVIAAFITAVLLRKQIKLERDRIDDERRRKLRAARAILPGVLSDICSYADAAAHAILDKWPAKALLYPHDRPFPPDEPPRFSMLHMVMVEMPTFPPGTVQTMQTVIEHVDDKPVIDRVASIFREVQILEAWTRPLKGGTGRSLRDLASHVQQAASIYARAASLFDFARNASDTISDDDLWDEVTRAFMAMNVHNPMVLQVADEQRKAGLPPGNADRGWQA